MRVRFYSHTKKVGDCIVWTGSLYINPSGYYAPYGHFGTRINGKQRVIRAHRFAWFLEYGKWPEKVLDHLCKNKSCVNVKHLRDVTQAENLAARWDKAI